MKTLAELQKLARRYAIICYILPPLDCLSNIALVTLNLSFYPKKMEKEFTNSLIFSLVEVI